MLWVYSSELLSVWYRWDELAALLLSDTDDGECQNLCYFFPLCVMTTRGLRLVSLTKK